MRTILAATLLAFSATYAAAQTTFYSPGGDYLGQGTRHRNTTTFYDANGNFIGSSLTTGRSTNFFGRDGSFQGTLSRTGDTTNFYDRAGRYQGSVITMPSPSSVLASSSAASSRYQSHRKTARGCGPRDSRQAAMAAFAKRRRQ
jgi:hypothetical protein